MTNDIASRCKTGLQELNTF